MENDKDAENPSEATPGTSDSEGSQPSKDTPSSQPEEPNSTHAEQASRVPDTTDEAPDQTYGSSLADQATEDDVIADSDSDTNRHDDSGVSLVHSDQPDEEDPYHDHHHEEASYHDSYHDEHHDTYDDEYHRLSTGPRVTSSPESWHRHEPSPLPEDVSESENEDYGGPVKPFLEHLEDLRWVLIKSLSAVMIAMIVCLVAGNTLVEVLKAPLKKAEITAIKDKHVVHLVVGTNVVGNLTFSTNTFGPFNFGDRQHNVMELAPIQSGTNIFMGLKIRSEETSSTDLFRDLIELKNYSPVEGFVVALQLALYGGIGLASPFVLYFIGDFVLPALRRNEKKLLMRAVVIGAGLFILGVVFCYYMMLHIALYAATNFSTWLNFGANEWRASAYIGFICKFMLGMGLGFELPVIILSLVKLGILSHQQLSKGRPYWLVANLVMSSMLTPPDPGTMILMALPLQLLYELSVLVAWIWDRRDRKQAEKDESESNNEDSPPTTP